MNMIDKKYRSGDFAKSIKLFKSTVPLRGAISGTQIFMMIKIFAD
jgi:hypothetical protein